MPCLSVIENVVNIDIKDNVFLITFSFDGAYIYIFDYNEELNKTIVSGHFKKHEIKVENDRDNECVCCE